MAIYLFCISIALQDILCYNCRSEERTPDQNERQEEIQRSEMAMEQTNTGRKGSGLSLIFELEQVSIHSLFHWPTVIHALTRTSIYENSGI